LQLGPERSEAGKDEAMTTFDPVAFKAATHQQWNAVAERWNA
jgi:hypothetical protein